MNKPQITNGANELGTGKIVDSSLNQATGKMVTPGDQDGGPEAQPNDCEEMDMEADTESLG